MRPSLHPEPQPVDMSPEAVDSRIRELADLWDLWIRLELDRLDGKLSGPGIRTTSLLSTVAAPDQEPPRP
ncbi:MAG: hypothetical protein HY721_23375 [Planctomycetes bacterium]|nr:hypothetical protein [Planctomycetota bacterium]